MSSASRNSRSGRCPLNRIRQIIEGPARVAGLKVEEGLISAASSDAGTEDALPLLAFTLRELYDRYVDDRNGGGAARQLSLVHYAALGDPSGGLNPLENSVRKRADEVLAEVNPSPEDLQALREAFIGGLVWINSEGEYSRRPARLDQIPDKARPILAEARGGAARHLRRGGRPAHRRGGARVAPPEMAAAPRLARRGARLPARPHAARPCHGRLAEGERRRQALGAGARPAAQPRQAMAGRSSPLAERGREGLHRRERGRGGGGEAARTPAPQPAHRRRGGGGGDRHRRRRRGVHGSSRTPRRRGARPRPPTAAPRRRCSPSPRATSCSSATLRARPRRRSMRCRFSRPPRRARRCSRACSRCRRISCGAPSPTEMRPGPVAFVPDTSRRAGRRLQRPAPPLGPGGGDAAGALRGDRAARKRRAAAAGNPRAVADPDRRRGRCSSTTAG